MIKRICIMVFILSSYSLFAADAGKLMNEASALISKGNDRAAFGLLAGAISTGTKMKDSGKQVSCFERAADLALKMSDSESAKAVLMKAGGACERIRNLRDRARAMNSIAKKILDTGKYDFIPSFFQRSKEFKVKAGIYCDLAIILAKKAEGLGDTDEAKELKKSADSAAKSVIENAKRKGTIKIPTLTDLALRFARAGLYEYAINCAKAVERGGQVAVVLRDVAMTAARAGNYDQALKVVSEIQPGNVRIAESLRLISEQYVRDGQYEKGIALAETIPKGSLERTLAFGNIATTKAREGDFEKAISLLDKIEEGSVTKRRALIALADGYAKVGQYDKAVEYAEKLKNGSLQKDEAYMAIAKRYKDAGQQEKAEEMYKKLKAGPFQRETRKYLDR